MNMPDEPADARLARLRLEMRPARFGRHPEDVLRAVFVRVLRVRTLRAFGFELRVLLLEGVGDVLEKDEAEDNVLVFGRVHAAAQRVGHFPEFGLVADGGAGGFSRQKVVLLSFCQRSPHESYGCAMKMLNRYSSILQFSRGRVFRCIRTIRANTESRLPFRAISRWIAMQFPVRAEPASRRRA
jgi:hypothetical protein